MAKPKPKPILVASICDVCGKRHWRSATLDSLAHWGMPAQTNPPKDLLEMIETESI